MKLPEVEKFMCQMRVQRFIHCQRASLIAAALRKRADGFIINLHRTFRFAQDCLSAQGHAEAALSASGVADRNAIFLIQLADASSGEALRGAPPRFERGIDIIAQPLSRNLMKQQIV